MKASLCIEAIGHNTVQALSAWTGILKAAGLGDVAKAALGNPADFRRWGCWEITEYDSMFAVYGKTDYSQANSKGSRGVRIFYTLESGCRYLVKSPQSWKNSDVYICTVTEEGEIVREKTIRD